MSQGRCSIASWRWRSSGWRRPRSLVVTGGATLFRLVRALDADALLVTGELMPGIAVSRLEGGRWPGATVLSKSGAFGAPDLLVRWWDLVQPEEGTS